MTEHPELLASYWTVAGGAEPHTDREYSPIDFRDRVSAAARAGFRGMGLWHADLTHSLKRYTLTEMKRILDDHGIVHVELEFLTDWFVDGERRVASDQTRRMLLTAAQALGARHLKVGDFLRTPCPMPGLIESFAGLCEDAAEHGTRVGFELMPFSTIDSLPRALELVTGANAPNGGIVLDLWHIVKLGIPYQAVAEFPVNSIFSIELNDGRLKSMPDLVEETTQYRNLCGEGEFDVRGFVDVMSAAGYRGPWGIEVLSKALRQLPIEEATRRAYDTTLAQFPGHR
ncbi:sugar phosphate isomerase/epimerase [Archangium violaceum]|uniref:sugar phosphate isomerase/epimerase family protein n=1 Tax=Archangium violaceum TaxID=83451 RepID=UPI00193B02D0|nr:sugar phosphate isomerase/epimerase [Archangium violaceum]QRK07206.1 sugar phosphate isomerase/epimerase [Archangium violaceum]